MHRKPGTRRTIAPGSGTAALTATLPDEASTEIGSPKTSPSATSVKVSAVSGFS
ncbi:MAG: hypothetical protein ACRD3V_12475 [Vicinamibacteria bacterium]